MDYTTLPKKYRIADYKWTLDAHVFMVMLYVNKQANIPMHKKKMKQKDTTTKTKQKSAKTKRKNQGRQG